MKNLLFLLGFIFLPVKPTLGQIVATDATLKSYSSIDNWAVLGEVDARPLADKTPLILIHGINRESIPGKPIPEVWNNFIEFFNCSNRLSSAYKLYTFKYYSNEVGVPSLATDFRELLDHASLADPTNFGKKEIALVCHSMGGLIARSALNFRQASGPFGGAPIGDRVNKMITLATPFHGTPGANGPARDQKIANIVFADAVKIVDDFIWLGTHLAWDTLNRSDLRWDNYDGFLDYTSYSKEANALLASFDKDTTYDSKIIAYAGTFQPADICSFDVYCWGSTVLKKGLKMDNDGIVPVVSAKFDQHAVTVRPFNGYNHSEMAAGKMENRALFEQIAKDLLGPGDTSINVTLISPSGAINTSAPTYKWYPFPSASFYILFADDNLATNKTIGWFTPQDAGCADGIGICSVRPNKSIAVGPVNWRVMAIDGSGGSYTSTNMAFSVTAAAKEIVAINFDDRGSGLVSTIYRIAASGKLTDLGSFNGAGLRIVKNENGDYFILNYQSATAKNITKVSPDGKQTVIPLDPVLVQPVALALEKNGNFIIGDNITDSVYRFDSAQNKLTRILQLPPTPNDPQGMAVAEDAFGNVIIASGQSGDGTVNSSIIRVSPDGSATTVYSGRSIKGTIGLTIDSAGNYIIADHSQFAIWSVSPAGKLNLIAQDFNFLCCSMVGVSYDSSRDSFVTMLDFGPLIEVASRGIVRQLPCDIPTTTATNTWAFGVFAK